MRRSDFHYHLPAELIARYPAPSRSGSRLLRLQADSGALSHHRFADLVALLRPGDLLVANDSRVIPARLYGRKPSGGRVELLVERMLSPRQALCHLRASKPLRPGGVILLPEGVEAQLIDRQADLHRIELDGAISFAELLARHGEVPLPPYMARAAEPLDRERYQTLYARQEGSVAAPTAGLHFDQPLLSALAEAGIDWGTVTLHVGAGTFQPVRVDALDQHRMHSESIEVSPELVEQVARTRQRGGRVVAVGTTSVRALESAAQGGLLQPFSGETQIFIHPGAPFRVVDALITNFHLPESTLLMLVAAFAGHRQTMEAYRVAVEMGYHFFSYGDAMLIEHGQLPWPRAGAAS
ncbi:MAG TPA: tRNA preQ1(34) S-adenosylmethionine ribosyltransferase-isomerase QueA [Pseudomonadales bacterium]|nr:tRNA preQ1(34) S-adenosylmethionine ribosyltransferase-isomerase QueA [Pseudomonadales bacterium]